MPSAVKISATCASNRDHSAGRDLAARRARRARCHGKTTASSGFHTFSCSVGRRRRVVTARGGSRRQPSRRDREHCDHEHLRQRERRDTPRDARPPDRGRSAASCVERPKFAITATAAASCHASRAARRPLAEPPGDEALDEPILRRVDDAVDAREHGGAPAASGIALGGLAALAAVEALDVEVDAQDERQKRRSAASADASCP